MPIRVSTEPCAICGVQWRHLTNTTARFQAAAAMRTVATVSVSASYLRIERPHEVEPRLVGVANKICRKSEITLAGESCVFQFTASIRGLRQPGVARPSFASAIGLLVVYLALAAAAAAAAAVV